MKTTLLLVSLLFTSSLATAEDINRCSGKFLNCRDPQTNDGFSYIGMDTCARCKNVHTGQTFHFAVCKKNGDKVDGNHPWSCKEY